MFQGRVGPLNVYSKATLGQNEMPFVQLNANAMDVIELVFTFQAVGKFTWSFHIPQNVNAVFLTHSDNSVAASPVDADAYCQSCLVRMNTAGPITFLAAPDPVTLLQTSMSNVMLFARKIGQACPNPPSTAPGYDDNQWWAKISDLTGKTQKWVNGYHVRYAVSFYTDTMESPKGPWSDWFGSPTYAWPRLVGIPVCSYPVEGRKIYRQFDGFPEELVVTLDNNTDTLCQDSSL